MVSMLANLLTRWKVALLVMFCLAVKRDRWLLKLLGSDSAGRIRARYGIHAFIGENGSGKTNLMVRQATRALDRGRTVVSSVPLYVSRATGELHPNYVPFTSWEDLRELRNCHILMDEMTGIANARENAPLPGEIQLILNQLRKRKIVLLWSSPSWEDAQAQIRRVTKAVTYCQGSWPDTAAFRAASEADDAEFDEGWIPNRLFRARTYKKSNVAEWSIPGSKRGLPDPVCEEWYWGPGSRSFDTYDTQEETMRLGQSNEFGICIVCEGSRRRPECTCHDYAERKARAKRPRTPVLVGHAGEHAHLESAAAIENAPVEFQLAAERVD